jgi:hypothetical protein
MYINVNSASFTCTVRLENWPVKIMFVQDNFCFLYVSYFFQKLSIFNHNQTIQYLNNIFHSCFFSTKNEKYATTKCYLIFLQAVKQQNYEADCYHSI